LSCASNSYDNSNGSIEDSLVKLLQSMDRCEIDVSIVISSYKVNKDRPSTNKIVGITEKHDNLAAVGGYSIDNHTIEDFRNYRKWLLENKLKGIKIYCGYEHYFPTKKIKRSMTYVQSLRYHLWYIAEIHLLAMQSLSMLIL
jgi:hypothetical protein